ncbi:MAG: hypothetical protein KatS3mg060_2331 [Dehalococcoidia bacterium]|nr:MAG: hypothetical protein KatS3mg060_2331 [Dehalococcoidia bacterium]
MTDEAEVGTRCLCGGCHPTATVYRDDPLYERHDPRLAEGPCCCGRFFVVGASVDKARERAEAMAAARQGQGVAPGGFDFHTQRVPLPWGAEVVAVVADLRG